MERRSEADKGRGGFKRAGATRRKRRTSPAKGIRINVKRAYEAPASSDGCRVLVDRIWPRGRAKEDLRLDDWVKDLAPSEIVDDEMNAIPAARPGSLAIGHRTPRRACRSAEQQP